MRQERTWPMAFTGDLWRECSRPISDLRVSRTVSITKRLAQHDLVSQGHQVVPHVPADTGDEVQAALPECLEQVLTDIDLPPEKWTPGYANFRSACSGVM